MTPLTPYSLKVAFLIKFDHFFTFLGGQRGGRKGVKRGKRGSMVPIHDPYFGTMLGM